MAHPPARGGGGMPVPQAMAKAWRPYDRAGSAADLGGVSVYWHDNVTKGGVPLVKPCRRWRRRRCTCLCSPRSAPAVHSCCPDASVQGDAPGPPPLPSLPMTCRCPEPGIGGELMSSTLVSGAPDDVIAALTHPCSPTGLLGPAQQSCVLREGDGWQVRGA
jgi:hypothetical protein